MHTSRWPLTLLILATLLALAGCTEESANIDTGEIRFDVTATAGERVMVRLYEGDSNTTSIVLSAGDSLYMVADGGAERVLSDSSVAEVYEAELPEDVEEIVVGLRRDAHASVELSVDMPPHPSMTSPTSFSRSDEALKLTWSDPVPRAYVAAFIDRCSGFELEAETAEETADIGALTVPMSRVRAEVGGDADCAVVELERQASAYSYSGVHQNSAIWAKRYTEIVVALNP